MARGDSRLQCPQCFTINADDSRFCSKCGSSLSELFETMTYSGSGRAEDEKAGRFTAGQMFDGRYRIIEEIGRGGMGRVFKAEDTQLGITVALKVIRPRLASDPRFVDRFKKEMLLARSISHESVVRIFDLGEAHGTKYISMEYIKGQSLKDFLHSSGTLSIETVTHIGRQIGEALAIAHAKGIVHQDLKPSNIVIDQSGRAYILDFGLAKAVHAMAAEREGESAGTPQYMSPEQATGGKVGPASDIYSYGAVLYEMVTGKPLFEAETPAEYKKKHASERPAPPTRINPHLPRPLEHIILKCLEKNPAERYGTIAEVLADLDRAERAGRAGRTDGAYRRIFPLERLGKRWAYAAGAVLLAGLAGLFYVLFLKPPAGPSGRRLSLAVVYLTNNTGVKSLDYMGRTLGELLIADLLQSQYIRVATGDRIYGILKSERLLDAPAYSTEDLLKVAALTRADYVLQGNFTKVNDTFRVNALLHRSRGLELVNSFQEEGTESGIFDMAEGLTRKVKESLHLSARAIAGDAHRELKKITTGSAEAYRHYLEGKSLFNGQKFEESIAALEKAVSLDPEFAMAYLLLADNYSYLRDGEQYQKNLSKARSLINRVSERDYYMIQAALAPDVAGTIEAYSKLLTLYPDDLDALGDLGAQYRNQERWDLAAEQFEKLRAIDDGDELAYENLAVIYAARGDHQKAVDLLLSKQNAFASYFGFHVRLSATYLPLRRFDEALAEARRARIIDPTDFEPAETEGLVHMIKGDPAAAERCFREMIAENDPQFQISGRLWLCHLTLAQGRYDQLGREVQAGLAHARTAKLTAELRAAEIYAMSLLEAVERLRQNEPAAALEKVGLALEAAQETDRFDYVSQALHFRGIIQARMKRFEEAEATAAKLKAVIEKTGLPAEFRLEHRLRGEIAREKGDLAAAVAFFERALSRLPSENYKTDLHVLYLDSLASALCQKKDWETAQRTYEKMTELTTGRFRWGDLYARSFYRLGKIHQAKGDKERAAGYYRRFLEVWSHADPGLPEIVDARAELAALGSRPPD